LAGPASTEPTKVKSKPRVVRCAHKPVLYPPKDAQGDIKKYGEGWKSGKCMIKGRENTLTRHTTGVSEVGSTPIQAPVGDGVTQGHDVKLLS
jgi:hypothetical protein